MSLLVVGSIAFDSVETPTERRDNVIGGSATYFSYAASYFTKVNLVGVVGGDWPDAHTQLLEDRDVDTAGLVKVDSEKTFNWTGKYLPNMNDRETLDVNLNVFGTFDPVLPESYKSTPYVFLANGMPAIQMKVLDQVESPKLVVADTMDLWINEHRDSLLELLKRIDGLVLNDSEAKLLTGHENLVSAAKAVLEKNGVQTEVVYPKCCGMPQLEYGDLAGVAKRAEEISVILRDWIDKGYDIVTVVPSCALMLKFEWPLILPNNQDVEKLSNSVYDITEYLVDISKNEGLAEGMSPIGDITVHISCHSRAQNIGQKGAEVLHKIPDTQVTVLDQCSGHGGTWGVMKENYEVSLKVGKPVARKVSRNITENIVSECPLARDHILHGLELLVDTPPTISIARHPIELVAQAYGLNGFGKQGNL